jgi:hypothetical protein
VGSVMAPSSPVMRNVTRFLTVALILAFARSAEGQLPIPPAALQQSVEELRASIGLWETTTAFLNEDGSVAGTVTGTYEFSWIVVDRVAAGRSEIPELQQASGILFYISESKGQIEMVSVGGDGNLWIMTGPLGGSHRLSQEFRTAEGAMSQLRFTRFNVARDSFESRMEYTEDGGRTWRPGNHQVFRRLQSGM